jgi:hypothetical protein
MLDEKPAFEFEDLFLGRTWSSERELRTMLVVTLMSILEMVKLGVAGVQQVPEGEKIRIYRRAAVEQVHELIAGYDEEASFGAPAEAATARAAEADADAAEEAALLAEALAAAQEPAEPVESFDGEVEEAAANDVAEETDELVEETGETADGAAGEEAEPEREDEGAGLFVNTEGGLGDRLLIADDEEDRS